MDVNHKIGSGKNAVSFFQICFSLFLCFILCFSKNANADDAYNWGASTLTGDWNGNRSSLSDRGINFEFTHRSDVISNTEGSLKQSTAWLGYTDARLLADLDKFEGWKGLTLYLQYHSELGDKPNAIQAGSYMGVDNIETPVNTAQFYQAWLQKSLLQDTWFILIGLYPIDAEFYVTNSSDLFIHPSLGMAAEIAQSGINGPPVFPMGSIGTRIKYVTHDHTTYAQLAILDGVPGDPNNPYGTQIILNKSDGTFVIAEVGFTPLEKGQTFEPVLPEDVAQMEPVAKAHEKIEGINKTAIGAWRYTVPFNDLLDTDAQGNPIKRSSFGWYALIERTLITEEQDAAQGLAGFLRFGTASSDVHQSDYSFSAGLRYVGLFDGRDLDAAGIAMTSSHPSDKYRSLSNSITDETMLELTYRFQLRLWISVQPFVQHIFHPGMNNTTPDVNLLGIRTEVSL